MAARKKTVEAAEVQETVKAVEEKVAKTKATAKKTAKAVAKKTEEAVQDTAAAAETVVKRARKAAIKSSVYVQFGGNQTDLAAVEENVKAAYVAAGNKASTMKTVSIYVKPEEGAAYYVVNEEFTGRVDLF